MKEITPTILLLAFVALVGCSPSGIPFTHQLREQYSLTDDELKRLQYHLDGEVFLEREVASGEKQITPTHKLVTREGKTIEEVVIQNGTPGIAVDVWFDRLFISFEPGSSFTFGSTQSDRDTIGSYRLFARDWQGSVGGKIEYDGKTYHAMKRSSYAFLRIDKESFSDLIRKRKVLPGMTLPTQ